MPRPRKLPKPVWFEMLEEEIEKKFPRALHGATGIPKTCARIGCSVASFYQWKARKRVPDRRFLLALAEFMEIPVDRLLYLLSEGELDTRGREP